jgi:hypothetical protein
MNRNEIINWLYYEIGKQPESFKLSYSYLKDSEHIFTKHSEFLELLEERNMWKLEKVNHRSVLKNELVLDIDTKDKEEAHALMLKITDKLKQFDVPFKCYFTGSKGYHIHSYKNSWLFCSKEKREFEKSAIIKTLNCDGMKSYDKNMIAIEETPHWKTGNKKELVMEYGLWE